MNVKMNENSKKTDQHAKLAWSRAGRPLLIYFVLGMFKRTLINCKQ